MYYSAGILLLFHGLAVCRSLSFLLNFGFSYVRLCTRSLLSMLLEEGHENTAGSVERSVHVFLLDFHAEQRRDRAKLNAKRLSQKSMLSCEFRIHFNVTGTERY